MFEGTRVKIQVFTPDAETPISRQASVPVDENGVEFDDYSFLDLDGDPYYVVRAKIDIVGTTLRYETLQSGSFANVDDETGFNGLKVTLNAVADDPAMKLMGAEIVSYNNTLELPQDAVTARGASLWINVDGLGFSTGDGFELRFNLKLTGDDGNDYLTGGSGNDVILGNGRQDLLFGGGGRDMIDGGRGFDVIDGGAGRDILIGGRGGDIFVFGSYRGRDTVRDFDPSQDALLAQGAQSIDDLTLRDTKKGVVIEAGNGAILLENVAAEELTSDTFGF